MMSIKKYFVVVFILVCTLSCKTQDRLNNIKVKSKTSVQEKKLVFHFDFENHNSEYQDFTVKMANEDFNGIDSLVTNDVRGLSGGKTIWPQKTKVGSGHLRAHFPSFKATGKKTGFIFDKEISATQSAVLEYRVKFSNDFQWKFGGKLPGLAGGKSPVGCTQNQDKIKNGFSTRLMWRDEGKLVLYTYFPDRTTRCGEDFTIMENMNTEQWYTIKQELQLNTPGKHDGIVKMYVDNQLMLIKKDVLFRLEHKENVKVDRVLFHTYAGGNDDANWWSTKDQYIYFDDFKVWVEPK
jgi:hypothetical protein